MKEFASKQDYVESGKKGVVFLSVSKENAKIINERMSLVDRRIVNNNRKAAEKASSIILNR